MRAGSSEGLPLRLRSLGLWLVLKWSILGLGQLFLRGCRSSVLNFNLCIIINRLSSFGILTAHSRKLLSSISCNVDLRASGQCVVRIELLGPKRHYFSLTLTIVNGWFSLCVSSHLLSDWQGSQCGIWCIYRACSFFHHKSSATAITLYIYRWVLIYSPGGLLPLVDSEGGSDHHRRWMHFRQVQIATRRVLKQRDLGGRAPVIAATAVWWLCLSFLTVCFRGFEFLLPGFWRSSFFVFLHVGFWDGHLGEFECAGEIVDQLWDRSVPIF